MNQTTTPLRLVLIAFLLCLSRAAQAGNAGLCIGSFDPGTLGHLRVLEGALNGPIPLEHIYVSVNHNTAKDFNASVGERIKVLEALTAHLRDRVTILREPLEGRPEFARYLLERHQGKILGIFGDDTFEKNYKIFTTEAQLRNFDYLKVRRPEPLSTQAESVDIYVPDRHEIEIDADGLSSSLARDHLKNGADPVAAGVLSPEAYRVIRDLGLYVPLDPTQEPIARTEFSRRFFEFEATMRRSFPKWIGRSAIPAPEFKAGQTKEGQSEKFIRHLVESSKLPLERQWSVREKAESLLAVSVRSRPLRSQRKAGIFLGSFDPIGKAQRDLILRWVKEYGFDDFYVGVLETSRKDIRLPVSTRIERIRDALKAEGPEFKVEAVPSLAASVGWIRKITNEYRGPTTAFFGSNVFDANAAQLFGIPNLRLQSFEVAEPVAAVAYSCAESVAKADCESAALESVSVLDPKAVQWFEDRLIP